METNVRMQSNLPVRPPKWDIFLKRPQVKYPKFLLSSQITDTSCK